MCFTHALIVCICTSIIIAGIFSGSQEHNSSSSNSAPFVGHFSSWHESMCPRRDATSDDNTNKLFQDTLKSILIMAQNMTHINKMENLTISYNTINDMKDDYKYILTEDSFKKLRRSSLRINEFRGNFANTSEILVSLDPELTLLGNITQANDSSRLIKQVSVRLKKVILSTYINTTKELEKNYKELFSPPKYENFDYEISVKNYELIENEPSTDYLIMRIKDLILLAVKDKLSDEFMLGNLSRHFFQVQLEIYCIPYYDEYKPKHYIHDIKKILSDSITWEMSKVTINRWANFTTINIAYLEKSFKIQLGMTNAKFKIKMNSTNLKREIENEYEIDHTLLTLDANNGTINEVEVNFERFKSTYENLQVGDNLVENVVREFIKMIKRHP